MLLHITTNKRSKLDWKKGSLFSLFVLCNLALFGQLSATFTTTVNTNCNGNGCNYSGPSILINELMISPSSGDGSISGDGGISTGRGEWIELYNPNLCEPVDISCYYLGNNTGEGNGGYVIPAGTIIPPAGFCMVRGSNASPVPTNLLVQNGGNVVELVVPTNVTDEGVCTGGTRLWFPNAGGWFAFYDNNGVPQDAVSWVNASTNTNGSPCVASLTGCNPVASLPSYDNIPTDRKNMISSITASNHTGQSLRRTVDGGAWPANTALAYGAPTFATCNSTCVNPNSSTCTGTATVNPTGGTAPYTFSWNDSEAQLTQTAIGLCAGDYVVTITDDAGLSADFTVTIVDFVPTVSLDLVPEVCLNVPTFNLTGASPIAGAGQTGVLSGNGISGSDFNPQTAGVGTQTITYVFTDEFGCTNSSTDQIIVNPLPTPSITGITNPYCVSNGAVALSVSPVGGALTGTGITGTNFDPATAGVGTHVVTYNYTDANTCSNSVSENIQVVGLPVLSISGVNPTYCLSDTPVNFTLSPAGGTLTGPGVTNNAFIPSAAGIGTHTLTYTYTDGNSCSNTTTTSVTVVTVPSPSITTPTQICNYEMAITLTGTPTGGVFTVDGTQATTLDPATIGDGVHALVYTVVDINSCIATATGNIDVLPRPTLTNDILSVYCFNSTDVVLNVTPAGGTLSGDFISGNTLQIQGEAPGNYNVTYDYTDANNCSNSLVSPFVITSPITPNFSYTTDCFQNATFTNLTTPSGNYQYSWFINGSLSTTLPNPTIYFPVFGDQIVNLTVIDATNCVYDSTKTIFVEEGVKISDFVIPNVITPNQDGINEYIELPLLLEECLQYKIKIMNRWGNLVYEMDGAQNAFMGRDKQGKELQDGVYFYILESEDIDCESDQFKGACSGMITILRK